MDRVTDAPFTDTPSEYREICQFLDFLSVNDPNAHWESGRMNFWRYNLHAKVPAGDSFMQENAHIWRSAEGNIIGLCISEYGKDDFFVEIHPAYWHIWDDVFAWIDNTWSVGREKIEIDIFSDDVSKIDKLKTKGFTFSHHFENKRLYDLTNIDCEYELEDGYSVRPFTEIGDYENRVALVQSAFDNPRYSVENLKGLMASPDYMDEYHLVAVGTEGAQVAYCIGWHDRSAEASAYIEPVGTHAEYRRRGFASAVIKECFRRLRANGIRVVEIASRAEPAVSNYLYDSLKPFSRREVYKYIKAMTAR